MTSKLTFRARTLDASKPMAIYNAEDLPELTDLNAINRSVPAMPSGMEKEEESEKHLQDILDAQTSSHAATEKKKDLYIPTPEVFQTDLSLYQKGYKVPRQYIHVQPFSMDAEKPDYDMDDADEAFFNETLRGTKKFEVDVITFEDMIDRLEKNSGHSVVSAKEAKLLLKEDDDLILAVYDYWVDKRLRLKQPLVPNVKSDKRDIGGQGGQGNGGGTGGTGTGPVGSGALAMPVMSSNSSGQQGGPNVTNTNPYIAFRRRTEKMQTRKNRKNDEASYEKMLKLRRDLSRAIVLLEMVKRREKTKKEHLNLTAEIFEKRYQNGDYDGKIMAEIQAQKPHRVLQPNSAYFANRYAESWLASQAQMGRGHLAAAAAAAKRNALGKKRKKSGGLLHVYNSTPLCSDDDGLSAHLSASSDPEDDPIEAPFAFRRKINCQYLAPHVVDHEDNNEEDGDVEIAAAKMGGWPWEPAELGGGQEARYRYSLASLSTPKARCIGMARRRVGRGGRYLLDRAYTPVDSLWRKEDENWPHYRPVTPPHCQEWDGLNAYNEAPLGLPTQPIRPVQVLGQVKTTATTPNRQRTVSGLGLRTVPVDSVVAQNAATAVVTNDMMDIFGK